MCVADVLRGDRARTGRAVAAAALASGVGGTPDGIARQVALVAVAAAGRPGGWARRELAGACGLLRGRAAIFCGR